MTGIPSCPTFQILVFFGATSTVAGSFALDSSVLDGTDTLGGDAGTDVTAVTQGWWFERGKDGLIFDNIDPAQGAVTFANDDRAFDPLYTSGAYYGNIRPGKRINISVSAITVFDGQVSDWANEWSVDRHGVAQAQVEDGLAVLGRQRFLDWTTTAGQTAGQRFTDILNRAEVAWSGGARDLDTGVSTLQADSVTWGSNVLNYCQLVNESDLGLFFASRDGLITFMDRHATIGVSADVTFGTGGIPFLVVGEKFGSEVFYTYVSVDRVGGTVQSVAGANVGTDGYRTLSLSGLLQDSDSQALDMATYLANVYAAGTAYISQIIIDLDTTRLTAGQITTVCQLDLGSVVAVNFTPMNIGNAITQNLVIQGIRYDSSPDTGIQVTFTTAPLEQQNPFILDDPTLGVLDSIGILTF